MMSSSKRAKLHSLNELIVPPQLAEIDKEKLQKLLQKHFPENATDPRWVMKVADAINHAHSRSRLACHIWGWPTDEDVRAQLSRVVDSSNELLEALSGTSARRHQTSIADRLWYPLHSFWTLLYGPPEHGDFWQKDPNRPSELEQAFLLLRKLNQRSRRILRRLESRNLGKQPIRSGNKSDHFVDSFVLCLGSCSFLGGSRGRMTERQKAFITDYMKAAGSKHTTQEAVRNRWKRMKRKDADPWREFDQQPSGHNEPKPGEI
jgi:hypothetical protein